MERHLNAHSITTPGRPPEAKCSKSRALGRANNSSRPACGPNSFYTDCKEYCPKTCDNYDKGPIACSSTQCKKGCQCNDGYVLDKDGNCVSPGQCQKCGPNSSYTSCGTNCPATCDTYDKGPIACDNGCNEGCQCDDGYVLDSDGNCVDPDTCPKCGPNSHYDSCGTDCPLTCSNYKNPPEVCTARCNPSCQCDKGYVRAPNGDCVRPKQCPKTKQAAVAQRNRQQTCGPNSYYTTCGTNCPKTCETYDKGPIACDNGCRAGCQCYDGYVLNSDGQCVDPQQCKKTCGPNQHYDSCVTGCPKTCENYNRPNEACNAGCGPGCACNDGYLRTKDGRCIAPNQCQSTCGVNEYYSNCKNPCNDCKRRGYCGGDGTYPCYYGCDCYNGYYRLNGTCVEQQQCAEKCGQNEYYSNCKNPCNDCRRKGYCGGDGTFPCSYGCDCNRGYYRLNGKCVPQQQCPAQSVN